MIKLLINEIYINRTDRLKSFFFDNVKVISLKLGKGRKPEIPEVEDKNWEMTEDRDKIECYYFAQICTTNLKFYLFIFKDLFIYLFYGGGRGSGKGRERVLMTLS